MRYTRRELGRMALAAIPAARIVSAPAVFARQAKPDSKVRGVTIGMNVPVQLRPRAERPDRRLIRTASRSASAASNSHAAGSRSS